MSGECDRCGEHCLDCEYKMKFNTAPVSNAYWGYVSTDFTFNTLSQQHKDALIRDLLESSTVKMSSDEIAKAEEESLWFEITDDGLKMSKELVEFIIEHGKSVTPPLGTVTTLKEVL